MQDIIHQSLDGNWKIAVIHQRDFIKIELPISFNNVIEAGSYGAIVLDAMVPGNFEIDLEKADIIPDPFYADNMLKMLEWENHHVFYTRKFNYRAEPGKKPEFIFYGIDTIADIYLNGIFLAHTENMFLTHRIDPALKATAEDYPLKEGENELVIHIFPACIEARKNAVSAGNSHLKYNYETLRLRKAPSMFGWDISPRLVSAGIYRSAGIYHRPPESIKQCYLMTVEIFPPHNTVQLDFFYEIDIGDNTIYDYSIEITGKCDSNDGTVSEFSKTEQLWFTSGKFCIYVSNAKLWWPKGYGDPNLYEIEIKLLKNSKPADFYKTKTGLRTVSLIRSSVTDMHHNGDFHFQINGKKVFIMGTNWVPVDSYHSRDKERIPQIMNLLDDIGCNAVRCWGGNIYEDPLFYECCDKMGIMVWQDFAMACGAYPTDTEFKKILYDEAVNIIRFLRQHPSIILWSGDNECDQFIGSWGLTSGRDPNLNRLTREVLPDAVYNEDPCRPFLPSSPYIDEEAVKHPWDYLPENHLWGPRDYFKSSYYKDSLSHFASEMGYHGMVSLNSIKRFISKDKLWPWQDNDEWILHAASPETGKNSPYYYRIELMAKQIKELFGTIPDNLEDFILASQISQGEAKKFFVELFRTQEHRTGIIWWNLIDCWPQFSDAVVDYYYDKKLAYFYLRQSQKPLILTFKEPENWKLCLCVSNLSGNGPLDFSYKVSDFASGVVVLSGKASCPDQGICEINSIPYSQGEKKIYLIQWECGVYSGKNHYLAGNAPFDLSYYRDFLKKEYSSWFKEIFQ